MLSSVKEMKYLYLPTETLGEGPHTSLIKRSPGILARCLASLGNGLWACLAWIQASQECDGIDASSILRPSTRSSQISLSSAEMERWLYHWCYWSQVSFVFDTRFVRSQPGNSALPTSLYNPSPKYPTATTFPSFFKMHFPDPNSVWPPALLKRVPDNRQLGASGTWSTLDNRCRINFPHPTASAGFGPIPWGRDGEGHVVEVEADQRTQRCDWNSICSSCTLLCGSSGRLQHD